MAGNNKLIGLAGTNGSGKDTLGQILAEDHGYLFFSVTDLLRAECRRRNIPAERVNQRMISAEWRKKYGLGVLVDKAVEHYEKVKSDYKGLVLASMRNPGEADRIHEDGGLMVWLDADPRVRYERIQANKHERAGRSEDDKTYEQFLSEEEAEMHSDDRHKLSTMEVKKRSDVFIDNGGDLESLKQEIKQSLFS